MKCPVCNKIQSAEVDIIECENCKHEFVAQAHKCAIVICPMCEFNFEINPRYIGSFMCPICQNDMIFNGIVPRK